MAALVWEANTIYSRGELTLDYAVFGPAVSSISHLSMSPHVFMPNARGITPFLGNHFEWITWPFALFFGWFLRFPTWVILLVILQALPTALVGPLGAYYATLKAKKFGLTKKQTWIVSLLPPILALTSIWLYWDSRFDFHYQALQGCLVVAILLSLEAETDVVALILGAILVGTGETASVLFIPIALFLLFHKRLKEAGLAVVATVVTLYSPQLFGVVTQDASAFATGFHYLNPGRPAPETATAVVKLVLLHPSRFLSQFWTNRLDAWAELASSGFVGLFSPVALMTALVVGVPIWGSGAANFAVPLFQTIIVVQLPIFASGAVLVLVVRKSWPLGRILAAVAIVWSSVWLFVFGPLLVRQIDDLSTTSAGHSFQVLNATLPESDFILSTNASIGDFPNHQEADFGCTPVAMLPRAHIEVIIDPWNGIQTCGPYELLQELSKLASLPGATVQGPNRAGVYTVHIDGTKLKNRRITINANQPLTGNFLIAPGTQHGRLVHSQTSVSILSRDRGGFVVEGLVSDLEPRESGKVIVQLSVEGTASLQVWNDNSGVELAQARLTSNGSESIVVPFNSGRFARPKLFNQGVGPFSTKLLPPIPLNPIEVRVFAPSGSKVSVFSISIR